MKLVPLKRSEANEFIAAHHRHNKPVVGDVIRVGVAGSCGGLIGVGCAGRPVSRMLDDGTTLEVTRVCVADGYPNACSMIYGALKRAAKALGYERMYTYTLASEGGASLRASGWTLDSRLQATRGWARTSRDREPLFTDETAKVRWCIDFDKCGGSL